MQLDRPRFATHAEVFEGRPAGAERFRFGGLWLTGSLDSLRGRTIAVVGSRAPSEGGRSRALALGAALARAGVCVLSGLAHGVDAAAHDGALTAAGATIGILGGGHRCFFPSRNRALAERIVASRGAVLSPYAPDEPARPAQFLQRNGVIAALADAVVIVEAAERSGALNTASWAASLGVDVLAYPGDVDRPKAAGCNALIRDGATLVRGPADVLAAIGIASDAAAAPPLPFPIDPLETKLIALLAADPYDLDTLIARTQAQTGDIVAALVRLEIAGWVERSICGSYAATRK